MRKVFGVSVLALFIAMTISYFSSNREIVVVIGDFSGSSLFSGLESLEGFRMALSRGWKVFAVDDGWDPSGEIKAYGFARSIGARFILFSTTSSALSTVYGRIADDGVFALSISSTHPRFSRSGDNLVRMVPSTAEEQKEIAEFMEKSGVGELLVFRDTSNPEYTSAALKAFLKSFSGIVRVVELDLSDADESDLLKGYAGEKNVYVIAGRSGNAEKVVRLISRPGVRVFLNPWVRMEEAVVGRGRVVLPSFFPLESIESFSEVYRERFGRNPSIYSMLAYEAGWLVERVGFHDIERKLAGREFKTPFERIRFDENGDAVRDLHFLVFEGGEWREEE